MDEQCLQRLYTSDRTYRELLRNQVLTGLQEIESEAAYLSACAGASYAASGPANPRSDGLVCGPDLGGEDAGEMVRLLEARLASFDKFFASIGTAEIKAGEERLRAMGPVK